MASLEIGVKAPEFKGVNQNGDEIGLSDFAGSKVILFFYPKDNTPGCTAEACNLRDNYADLQSKGFQVIGVSADSVKAHTNFIAKHSLPYNLIADTEKVILNLYGAWGEKKMYGRTYDGIIRKTYIIDEAGVVEHVIEKVKTKAHTEQIFELLGL